MLYLILIGIPLLFLVYLLLAPLRLIVDSERGLTECHFGRLVRCRISWNNVDIIAHLRIGWWTKSMNVFARRATRKSERAARTSSRRQTRPSLRRILAVLRSFTAPVCNITIDTGDEPLNALLFPLLYLMSKMTEKNIRINFHGTVCVQLVIENTIGRMLFAFISNGRFQKRTALQFE